MNVIRIIVCVYFIAIAYNNLVREVKSSEVFKKCKKTKEFITALNNEINK